MRGMVLVVAMSGIIALFVACGDDDDGTSPTLENNGGDGGMTEAGTTEADMIQLTSGEFEEGGPIPRGFTCDGGDRSPPLQWGSRPDGAESLAIIMDDLDADFVHWVVYDLDPSLNSLDSAGNEETLPGSGAPQGLNSFGEHGYGGPCPPEGDDPHTYRFRLFVLDAQTGLPTGATADDLEEAMDGHILATGELTGTYAR